MNQIINLYGKNELSNCHLKTIEPKRIFSSVKISKHFFWCHDPGQNICTSDGSEEQYKETLGALNSIGSDKTIK
jgi:hypothetical protein